MPHITVEYSANLEPLLDVMRLLAVVHAAALQTGMVEIGGVRTRAERRDHFIIADGDPANAFVAITARVGVGRDDATRARFAETVFEAATEFLEPIFRITPLAISLEVAEIDPVGSMKRNNLHARMQARAAVAV
jgi:5-carboxymethyl-2-hydroxymuconate isomerase